MLFDPQERYDIFMTTFTENTWTMPFMGEALTKLAETYKINPPRPVQSEGYAGPMTITRYLELMKINTAIQEKGGQLKLTK